MISKDIGMCPCCKQKGKRCAVAPATKVYQSMDAKSVHTLPRNNCELGFCISVSGPVPQPFSRHKPGPRAR